MYAQFPIPQDSVRIRYFTVREGLSQATVNDVLLDSKGFVWVATEDGLNQFDGNRFKHFKHNLSDSTSISGNVLNKLLEDGNGNIWVGTIANGLNCYDKNSQTFKRFLLLKDMGKDLTVSDMTLDVSGKLWVSTRTAGLHQLSIEEDTAFSQKSFLNNKRLGALSIDENRKLWVGGFYGEVYSFDPTTSAPSEKEPLIVVQGYVQAFYHTNEKVLIGSDHGLFVYTPSDGKVRLFELEASEKHPTRHVVSFLEENSSQVWIGTGNGLYLLDWKRMKVVNKIEYNKGTSTGLSTNTVYSMVRLSKTQVLVGTAAHLNLLDFGEPHFKNLSKNRRGKHLLDDNAVLSVYKDGNSLWLGTADGGLNLIREGKTYSFKENTGDRNSISGSTVMGIAKDSINDRLWFATTRGLSMINLRSFDPENPVFSVFHHDSGDGNSIPMDYLTDVVVDKKSNIWGSTYGNGIFCMHYSPENPIRIKTYKQGQDRAHTLANNFVYTLEIDNRQNLWIGTEGGLSKMEISDTNIKNPKITSYWRQPEKESTLSHNSVVDILVDSDDQVWLATRYGLNRYLGESKFKSWMGHDQFPNAVVFSVQGDFSGNIWMGTNNGLVKYDPKKKTFSHYTEKDGIQGTEFNISARYRDASGMLFFGGMDGLTFFDPGDLEGTDIPMPLFFSNLRFGNTSIQSPYPDKLKSKSPFQKGAALELKHDQFPFYLEFSSLDFRMDKNVSYAFRLLPEDTQWNVLKDQEIQFVNLPIGEYKLQISGLSRGKLWETAPLEMDIKVLPPLWKTWWAYLLYGLVLITLVYLLYRIQMSRRMAVSESRRLREVNQLKNTLYANITHEFRTPLTVILGMTDMMKSQKEDAPKPKTRNHLELIERNSKRLLSMVNEMLDFSQLEGNNVQLHMVQTDIVSFVKYIAESFYPVADANDSDLVLYSEIDELYMDFDEHKVQTIVSNLLSNAFKYGGLKNQVVLHLVKEINDGMEFFVMKVKDEGIGIPEADKERIFDRFYKVDNSTPIRKQMGTGLGLALSKSFIEMLKGHISVESQLGKGSQFIVRLPITRSADLVRERATAWVDLVPTPDLEEKFDAAPEWEKPLGGELPLALLIEDNPDVLHYLEECLKDNYTVLRASDGVQGVQRALEHIPDIIICDIMMPGKNGLEVCDELKNDERTDHIPIIMLTAKVGLKDKLKGLACGADAYLTKPFVKEELFTRLDQLIRSRKRMLKKIERIGLDDWMGEVKTGTTQVFLKKVVKIVLEKMEDPSFGARHLARELHLSESQVYRKLKAVTNKSTALFIRSVRLQRAHELLKLTDKNISEVCYLVGFKNPSWFSTAFKEEYGYAPSAMSN